MAGASSALGSAASLLDRLWAAVNVKRRGQYSLDRLLALRELARDAPRWRLVCVVVLTPLPSLLAILALEVARLSPPSAGLVRQSAFFARELGCFCAIGSSLLQQASHQTGPALPISSVRLAVIAMIAAVINTGFTYALATRVGFPVPFSFQLCAPTHLAIETLGLAFTWCSYLRADPAALRHMARRGAFFLSQSYLITVYPVYFFVFTLVPAANAPRLALLSLLPLLKLANRWLFYRASRKSDGGAEFIPQLVVFNADVLGAIFVAFCMQYKPSLVVALGVAASKVLTAAATYHSIRQTGRQLAELEAQLRASRESVGDTSDRAGTADVSVLDEVAHIVAQHDAMEDAATTAAATSLKSVASRVSEEAVFDPSQPATRLTTRPCCLRASRVAPLATKASGSSTCCSASTTVQELGPHGDARREDLRCLEKRYVAFVSGLLYTAEFAILIEYADVFVPVLYVLYLVIMFRMPNRVFYAQFAGMDAANLTQTVVNVLLYTAFELVSLVVVHVGFRRMLRASPVRHLGFVLTRQAVHVQSALLLWVVFSTQASLDHYGIDYSFQFAWLSNSSDSTS